MKNKPLVSIITPSYNQAKFIKRTIDSVLNQSYRNIEYFVIDGGSNDGTVEILKTYGNKLNWVSERDNGQMDALNKGLRKCKGEIIAFLNSDDWYEIDTIEKVVDNFTNPEISVVTGDYQIVDENEKKIQSFVIWWKKILRKLNNKYVMMIANYIIQPSTFWRSDVFHKVGFFNEQLHYVFDYEYWLRMYKFGFKFHVIEDVLCNYRIHSLSKGGSSYRKRSREEIDVQMKYFDNLLVNWLHLIHNTLMVVVYDFIQ